MRSVPGYYAERLSAERLRRCYEVAPPATVAYLEAEIAHLVTRVQGAARFLEMGCGYGRVLARIAPHVGRAAGIDTARSSLRLAREVMSTGAVDLAAMDAGRTAFRDASFDVVACIQNGVSAFGLDPLVLAREAIRITRPGGRVILSTYAERFWPDRLEWFERQADEGLLGEIDRERTGDGVIVCRDGFRATTMSPEGFRRLGEALGLTPAIREIAGSSLFCEFEPGRGIRIP